MKPTCHICETPSNFLLTKDGYDLYRCPVCELVFVFPQPVPDFLKDKVYSFESGYQSNKKGNFSDQPVDKKTRKIFELLKGKSGNLLDVGCSSGEFMHFAQMKGFKAYGVELNKRTADVAVAHGLAVFNGFLGDAKYQNEFFDVIFLGDIIEHVNSPDSLIAECSRILKKEGMIIISTPNLDCAWSGVTLRLYRVFGIPWSSVTPPYHLFQFSFRNLNRFMKTRNFVQTDSFFLKPPRLAYELGSLHLLKRWKQSNKIKDLLFMIFAFAMYTIFYGIDVMLTPIKPRDFSMVVSYIKE